MTIIGGEIGRGANRAPMGHQSRQVAGMCNQKNPGNCGKGNGVNVSYGSSQSARKKTASVSAEPIANSTTSSLSRAQDMTCNANATSVTYFPPNSHGRGAFAGRVKRRERW